MVGRWVIGPGRGGDGDDRPGAPRKGGAAPVLPQALRIVAVADDPAVISARYPDGGMFRRLKHAEDEASWLVRALNARIVKATRPDDAMTDFLQNRTNLVHFAGHGQFDETGLEEGLVMEEEGSFLRASQLRKLPLKSAFVFLNACEAGVGADALGMPGGIALAFLKAGAAAVVAPLWAVGDETSSVVARRFYRAVAAGKHPAQFLHELRSEFVVTADGEEPSVTLLAYLFFGHPNLWLDLPTWRDPDPSPESVAVPASAPPASVSSPGDGRVVSP